MANFSLSSAGHNIFGTKFTEPITAREALTQVGADFDVSLQPIIAANDRLASLLNGNLSLDTPDTKVIDGQQFVSIDMLRGGLIDEYRSTMRMDTETPLGIVGSTYTAIQNETAFNYVDMLTTGELGTKLDITNAGCLLGGRRVYMQAKFPEPVRMAGNNRDIIDMYITVSTGHDGGASCCVVVTPQRAACLNSLNYAIQHCASKIVFRHTANVGQRMDLINKENADMAYRTLKLYETYKQFFEQSLEQLAKIKLSDKQMEQVLVESVLPQDAIKLYKVSGSLDSEDMSTRSKNIISGILEANFTGVGQDIIEDKNSGLSLINALTTYYQNNVNWKDNEKKYLALTEGSVQTKLQNLYGNIIKLAA